MEEFITMTSKELRRVKVMQALHEKRLKQKEAAMQLSLSPNFLKFYVSIQ